MALYFMARYIHTKFHTQKIIIKLNEIKCSLKTGTFGKSNKFQCKLQRGYFNLDIKKLSFCT